MGVNGSADDVTGVYGRTAELDRIRGFLDEVAGRPAALLIEGPAGIGKTTLWSAGLDMARRRWPSGALHCGPARPQRPGRAVSPGCAAPMVSVDLRFVETYGDSPLGLLGDPSRRAIFELLARRPSSVGELASQLPISRPAVSQHLRVLKEGRLVVSASEGTRHVYRLNPDGVGALRAYLDRVWEDALTAFQKVAEAEPGPG